jgi:hypothetical protein
VLLDRFVNSQFLPPLGGAIRLAPGGEELDDPVTGLL